MSNRAIDHRQAALDFLYGRIDYERTKPVSYGPATLKSERMRELLERLGNPHHELPVVHVAGTKGKGSTAGMVAAALTAADYRTGMFSSPHLERVEERIAVDGRPQQTSELVALAEQLRPHVEAMDRGGEQAAPTYFELSTAMAFMQFRQARVDVAVLEVGMGGRLDSTNICQPAVSVITSISFDHTQQLGNTLAAIAGEKAGIIKPGVPVVSGVTQPEPRDVIRAVAARHGSRLIELDREFEFRYTPPRSLNATASTGQIDYFDRLASRDLTGVAVAAIGRHQAANAALAIATLTTLSDHGWIVPEVAIRRGLATFVCPARVEVLSRGPTVILDTAHNVASVEALLQTLQESFDPARRVLLFATTQDKDYAGMLEHLLPHFEQSIFTRYQTNPRGVPVEQLASVADGSPVQYTCCATPADAWRELRKIAQPNDLVCIAGSFYFAAEMRAQHDSHPLNVAACEARNIA